MTAIARTPGYSFCIITDGRRPALLNAEIESIRALALPAFEIIIVGQAPPGLPPDVCVLDAVEAAGEGRLGALRNAACSRAQFDHLVVADDDMHFHSSFGEGLRQAHGSYDVLCVRLLNPDGTRFWDWATFGGPRGHMLLDYDETDDHVYVTGGLAVMRASVFDQVPWNADRGFYQGEDIEWSSRVRAAGCRIRFNAHAMVTHQDTRYTQHGRVLHFSQDLTVWERLGRGVEGAGFFREGPTGCRWMSDRGSLRVSPDADAGDVLHFTLRSVAPTLTTVPFNVNVYVNDVAAGQIPFSGQKQVSLTVPIMGSEPMTIRLQSERSTPGTTVGIPDQRLVSVLIKDVRRAAA